MDIDFVFALHSTAKLMWKSELNESQCCPPLCWEYVSDTEELATSSNLQCLVLQQLMDMDSPHRGDSGYLWISFRGYTPEADNEVNVWHFMNWEILFFKLN